MKLPEMEITYSCGHTSMVHEAPGPTVPWVCNDCHITAHLPGITMATPPTQNASLEKPPSSGDGN